MPESSLSTFNLIGFIILCIFILCQKAHFAKLSKKMALETEKWEKELDDIESWNKWLDLESCEHKICRDGDYCIINGRILCKKDLCLLMEDTKLVQVANNGTVIIEETK